MSTSTTCQKCGTLNAAWAKFCAKCGNPLTTTLQPPATPSQIPGPYAQAVPPPWYTYTPTATYEYQRRTEIDRTKTGLLLLMIGTILGPVPIITFIGGILALIGAILVILGRKAFGSDHSRNAIWSIIIYIVGLAIIAIGAVAFFLESLSAAIAFRNGGAVDRIVLGQALQSSFETLIIAAVIGGAVLGMAQVLFTYAIQNRNGKIILWSAYATSIAISIVNLIIVAQLVSDAVARSFVGSTFDPGPLQTLQGRFQVFALLGFIPAALYSTALYLAWSRIGRGELPSKTPTVPVTPQPSPSSSASPPPPPPSTL